MLGNRTVCLSMIVKDEAHVIKRALASALPYIDSYVIVDTGSTDKTIERIKEALGDLPGEILERPWCDFSTNRNQALLPALRMADYALVLDADETLEAEPWFACRDLEADSYMLEMRLGTSRFLSRRLLGASLPWAWQGVLHEYPDCSDAAPPRTLLGLGIRVRPDGSRSRDPDKFKRDAEVLLRAIEAEPDNARYRFYLGQTYRDDGRYREAADAYRAHIALGTGWDEEVWNSRMCVAWCEERLGSPWPLVMAAYMEAFAARPDRAEPLFFIGRHYVMDCNAAVADFFLKRAYECPIPLDAPLFVDRTLHALTIPMEYAYLCAKMGRFTEALTITNRLLAGANLPDQARIVLLENQAQLNANQAALRASLADPPPEDEGAPP